MDSTRKKFNEHQGSSLKQSASMSVSTTPKWNTFPERLAALDEYFVQIPFTYNSQEEKEIFAEMKDIRQLLRRTNRQVTFFGAFKAGKSTLLNALIGQNLLPSRTNRATGVITAITYSQQPLAQVIYRRGNSTEAKSIHLEDIGKYILLDVSDKIAKAPENIERVEVKLPLPLLKNKNLSLVDTPGLLDNPILTQVTWQEIERSDLCIVVLPADKLLSQPEKEAIEKVNKLLHGNILFVINKIGAIDPEDKDEVIQWVRDFLQSSGNCFVGKPRIFPTDAKTVLASEANNVVQNAAVYIREIGELRSELNRLFSTPIGERLTIFSRLSILNSQLEKTYSYLQLQLVKLKNEIKDLERQALEDLEKRKKEFDQIIQNTGLKIIEARSNLYKIEEDLVPCILDKSVEIITSSDNPNWDTLVKKKWKLNCSSYISQVKEQTELALSDIESIEMHFHRVRFEKASEIIIENDIFTSATKLLGGEFALGMSRWIGQKVLKINLKEDNIAAVRNAAYISLGNVKAETDNYIEYLKKYLNEYSYSHQPKLITPAKLIKARENKKKYADYLIWCENFQKHIQSIKEEVMSWQSEFDRQWDEFNKLVECCFREQHEKQKGIFRRNTIPLNKIINTVIKEQVLKWKNQDHAWGLWFRNFNREHSDLGEEFVDRIKKLKIESKLRERQISNSEKFAAFFTITISLLALLWGQNLRSLSSGNLNINKKQYVLVAFITLGGFRSLEVLNNKREKKEISKLCEDIYLELNNKKKELISIVSKADQLKDRAD